jgi:hypothetical protein
MTENPYNPPRAHVEDVLPPLRTRGRKPISVWLMQGLLVIFAGGLAFGVVRTALEFSAYVAAGHSAVRTLSVAGARVLLCVGLIAVTVLIQKRSLAGRILGVILISLVTLGTAWGLWKPQNIEGNGVAYLVGWACASLFMTSLLIGWAYSFGFSRRGRAYFLADSDRAAPAIASR